MAQYVNVKVKISEWQKEKLQHALKANCPTVTIRLDHEDLNGNGILAVTKSQAKNLAKAHEDGKSFTVRMTSKQLKHNMKVEGGFLGLLAGLAARALLTNVSKNCFTCFRCWCFIRISINRSAKSDG